MWMVCKLDEQIHLLRLVSFIYQPIHLSACTSWCISFNTSLSALCFLWNFEGMLFDHTCDAFHTCVMIIPICSIFGMGWIKGLMFGTLAGIQLILVSIKKSSSCFTLSLLIRFCTILYTNLGGILYRRNHFSTQINYMSLKSRLLIQYNPGFSLSVPCYPTCNWIFYGQKQEMHLPFINGPTEGPFLYHFERNPIV